MRIHRNLLLSAAVALAVAAPAAAGPGNGGNDPQGAKDTSTTGVELARCDDNDSDGQHVITAAIDTVLWPPNHKYTEYFPVVATAAQSDDMVTLDTHVTHDEYVTPYDPTTGEEEPEEQVGSGNTVDDAEPFVAMDGPHQASATTEHRVRSERSGRGDGRTYTLSATGTFDEQVCSGSTTIEVPHDMRSDKAPPKEDKTDSTGPDQG